MIICPFTQALSWLQGRPGYYDVISVGRDIPRSSRCRRHLVLDFDDLMADPDPTGSDDVPDRSPQAKHVRQAVAFARKSEDGNLLIHCQAGISRSPAIAWCILLDRLGDPAVATAALFKIHPHALPNPLVVHCGLKVLVKSTKDFPSVRTQMRELSRHPQKLLFY